MKNQRPQDDDENPHAYFVVERPIEELPTFQSHIYNLYFPIAVHEQTVTDDISHRVYYGKCQNCSEEHYLGTVVMQCHEPLKLYARVK